MTVRSREIKVEKRYLNLPVSNDAPRRIMSFVVGDHVVRQFVINLADGPADFWVFSDVEKFKGQALKIKVEGEAVPAAALEAIVASD